ncbi:MAG: hypothetical protein HC851_23145 [Acaryochloris sp. RU_4_1]|nr:hypothetical protein [Acaryochloris sp. RU_4_1]NJR39439.1 hypothetical protein [Leptolyngbyaceae cyanobacterium CSU_1_4]NJR55897.1 hypothetical protein [Acaryochloris sp. CRU_2_0]
MTVTNVHISLEAQQILIKAAALKNVSVEELASEVLDDGIQTRLTEKVVSDELQQESEMNPLADLQPYAFYATPEESVLLSDDWDMEHRKG